jgi:hypothetical protein
MLDGRDEPEVVENMFLGNQTGRNSIRENWPEDLLSNEDAEGIVKECSVANVPESGF